MRSQALRREEPADEGHEVPVGDVMLNLYVNRAGRSLGATDRRRLERAKGELRKAFGRPPKRAA